MERDGYLDEIEGHAEDLRSIERVLAGHVARARKAGRSWAEIGTALGMTRQGAQQKYGRHCGET